MNPYFLLGSLVAVIAAAGAGYFQGSEHGQAKVQNLWDKEKAAQYAEYAKAQEEARKKEQELQANADKLRQEKDREIRDLNARATALNNSLQHRPTRTSQNFLSGTLPKPQESKQTSTNVSGNTKP